jgi:hypothetical protein
MRYNSANADMSNNTAIYYKTEQDCDVFSLDEAVDILTTIVGDEYTECLLSFHKYFIMGILLVW